MTSNNNFRNRPSPYGNPLANALVIVVGAVAIGVFFLIGMVALFALAAAVAILAAVFSIRVWWQGRKLRRQDARKGHSATQRPAGDKSVIEGEFRRLQGPPDREP